MSLGVAPVDGLVILGVLAGGLLFHWDAGFWGIAFVGDRQYGDAEFWWNGAIHLSRGILSDNPGRGFRPGYFLLTGPVLAVVGTDFWVVHKALAMVFLTVSAAFYLVLRDALGRLGALCGVALLVFNPFTAEWVSTSTTDGTALVLHVFALISLLLALERKGSIGWLAASSLLLALATLTRPIMTPFAGVVLLLVLVSFGHGWKRNAIAALSAAVVFLLPLLAWMVIQGATVGMWSVSSNDASAFYAASHPRIQTWNNEMYRTVEASAKRRLGRSSIDQRELNEEFWRLTLDNYLVHWRYHVSRLLPHVWEVARFGPQMAVHGSEIYRKGLVGVFLLGTVASLAWCRCWAKATLGLILFGVYMTQPWLAPACTVGGVVMAAGEYVRGVATGPRLGIAMVAVAAYWLTGALALALIGGTWSPAGASVVSINALGYRVGSQVFFAGDLLSLCLLGSLLGRARAPRGGSLRRLTAAHAGLSRLAWAGFAAVGAVVLGTLALGTLVIGLRWWALPHQEWRPYPSLEPVAAAVPGALVVTGYPELAARLGIGSPTATISPTLVTSGTGSEFLWNLRGQERAHLLFYQQTLTQPFAMHPWRMHLEFPQHERPEHWAYRQGAYVLKRISNRNDPSNLPYYLSEVAVRGFVPLSRDSTRYELSRARWFPLAVYASQLEANGFLTVDKGTADWRVDSGSHPFKRRLILRPDAPRSEAVVQIELRRFVRLQELRLEWYATGGSQGSMPSGAALRLEVFVGGRSMATAAPRAGVALRFAFPDPAADAARLRFSDVPRDGVALYELNVVAQDVEASGA